MEESGEVRPEVSAGRTRLESKKAGLLDGSRFQLLEGNKTRPSGTFMFVVYGRFHRGVSNAGKSSRKTWDTNVRFFQLTQQICTQTAHPLCEQGKHWPRSDMMKIQYPHVIPYIRPFDFMRAIKPLLYLPLPRSLVLIYDYQGWIYTCKYAGGGKFPIVGSLVIKELVWHVSYPLARCSLSKTSQCKTSWLLLRGCPLRWMFTYQAASYFLFPGAVRVIIRKHHLVSNDGSKL